MTSMLRAWSLSTLFAVAPFALAPVAAQAQAAYGVHFNIAAGLTEPTSTFGDFYDAGYNILVGIGASPAGSPLGFRVEGMYNEFGQKNGNGSGNGQAGGVTANAVYDLLRPSATQSNTFYVIGGIGYYNTKEPTSSLTARATSATTSAPDSSSRLADSRRTSRRGITRCRTPT